MNGGCLQYTDLEMPTRGFEILVNTNRHILAISIPMQCLCGRELREFRVDGKSLKLIAADEFLLLSAPSLKSAGVLVFETPQE